MLAHTGYVYYIQYKHYRKLLFKTFEDLRHNQKESLFVHLMEVRTQIGQVDSQRATLFCKDERIEKRQNEYDFRNMTTITLLSFS